MKRVCAVAVLTLLGLAAIASPAYATTEEHIGWTFVAPPVADTTTAQTVRVSRPASVTGDIQYRTVGTCMTAVTKSAFAAGNTLWHAQSPWTANANLSLATTACSAGNVLVTWALLVESKSGWSVALRWADSAIGTGGSLYVEPSPYPSPYASAYPSASPVDRLVAFCDPHASATPTATPSPAPSPAASPGCDMTVTVAETQWGVIGFGIGLVVMLLGALLLSGWGRS